jgi:hypothetical protein
MRSGVPECLGNSEAWSNCGAVKVVPIRHQLSTPVHHRPCCSLLLSSEGFMGSECLSSFTNIVTVTLVFKTMVGRILRPLLVPQIPAAWH